GGAGGRAAGPIRSESDRDSRHDRGRGGGRAVGRTPFVRAGLLRPRQRLLRRLGGGLPVARSARALPGRVRVRRAGPRGVSEKTATSSKAQGEATRVRGSELGVLTGIGRAR